jgi:hypothetical protein
VGLVGKFRDWHEEVLSRSGVTRRHSRSSVTARALRVSGLSSCPTSRRGAQVWTPEVSLLCEWIITASSLSYTHRRVRIFAFNGAEETTAVGPRGTVSRATSNSAPPTIAAKPQLTLTGGKDVMQQPARRAQFCYPLRTLRAGPARVDSFRRALAASDFGSRR